MLMLAYRVGKEKNLKFIHDEMKTQNKGTFYGTKRN